jgi:hypothetical protein
VPYIFARNSHGFRLLNLDDADPEKIGKRLESLSAKADGRLKPEAVVEDAAKPSSPTHKLFEWRDKAAAHQYRIDQARELLEMIRLVDDPDDEEEQPRRVFFSLIDPDDKKRSYRSIDEIMGDRSLRIALLKKAESELRQFESRYRELTEICADVRTARERARKMRNEEEARATT